MTENSLTLQVCQTCKGVNYPSREVCMHCLSDSLALQEVSGEGELLSYASLHNSNEQKFIEQIPVTIGTVKLKCGPVIIGFLNISDPVLNSSVRVNMTTDDTGQDTLQINS